MSAFVSASFNDFRLKDETRVSVCQRAHYAIYSDHSNVRATLYHQATNNEDVCPKGVQLIQEIVYFAAHILNCRIRLTKESPPQIDPNPCMKDIQNATIRHHIPCSKSEHTPFLATVGRSMYNRRMQRTYVVGIAV